MGKDESYWRLSRQLQTRDNGLKIMAVGTKAVQPDYRMFWINSRLQFDVLDFRDIGC